MTLLAGALIGLGSLIWVGPGGSARGCGSGDGKDQAVLASASAAEEDCTEEGEADQRSRGSTEGRGRRDSGHPRRGGGPPRPGMPSDEPLTDEQLDCIMKFAYEHFPRLHERLDRLRQQDPKAFRPFVGKMRGWVMPLIELEKRDPPLAAVTIAEHRVQFEIFHLLRQYRRTSDREERARLRSEIEAKLHEQFDRRQERLRLEIEDLRKRLDEQARQLTEREKDKEGLIRRELEKLTERSGRGDAGREAEEK